VVVGNFDVEPHVKPHLRAPKLVVESHRNDGGSTFKSIPVHHDRLHIIIVVVNLKDATFVHVHVTLFDAPNTHPPLFRPLLNGTWHRHHSTKQDRAECPDLSVDG
jgi:hypothetical protein